MLCEVSIAKIGAGNNERNGVSVFSTQRVRVLMFTIKIEFIHKMYYFEEIMYNRREMQLEITGEISNRGKCRIRN